MPFFNILHSFRVCVHAGMFVHAYESGGNCIHACNKKFVEGIMLVENEPPASKAGYGPGATIELVRSVSIRACAGDLFSTN